MKKYMTIFFRDARHGLGALAAVVLVATPASAETYPSVTSLVAAVMPSFVNISARGVKAPDPSAKPGDASSVPIIQDEVGSGFIVDPRGYVLTNRHVIEGAYALFVTMSDGTHVPAHLVAKALTFDVAIIQIDSKVPLQVSKIGDSDSLKVGDPVVAIGNPLGFANSVSAGVVSAFHRDVGLSAYDDLIQTDATINQGNSGGPLFNMAGEVVGINQAIYTRNGGGSIGIGFSIPVNAAKFLLDSVVKYGEPRVGWIGMTGQTFSAGMADSLGRENTGGVIVSAIDPKGSAFGSGLQVGDVILKGDGRQIRDITALNRFAAASADKKVTFEVLRGGKDIAQVEMALKRWPRELWSTALVPPPTIKSLDELGAILKDKPGSDGPVVDSIVEKSLSWNAGLRTGDIIRKIQGQDIHSVADVVHIFEHPENSKRNVLIFVDGPNGPRWLDAALSE
jgi:serine protease Do